MTRRSETRRNTAFRWTRPRGQGGFMLAAVIVVLGFFAIIGSALMAMSIVMLRVTESHAASADRIRAADGALEIVINDLRLDGSAAGHGCVGSATHYGFDDSYEVSTTLESGAAVTVVVECSAVVTAERRVISLTARPGSDWSVAGKARVRIDDEAEGTPSPGAALLVCDWQLGAAVATGLADCPV